MNKTIKVALITGGATVIAAILGIVPGIINSNNEKTADKVANAENDYSIKIENNEADFDGSDGSINIGANTGTINQPTNNYYYNYYLPADLDNHAEDDSEQATNGGSEFYIEMEVRNINNGDNTWRSSVYANVGDIVEFQMQYMNISDESHKQVVIRDILPKSLRYIEGTTKLYNTDLDGAVPDPDTITTDGVNIGNYAAGANAYIRFRAEVVGDTLSEGLNLLYNWGQVQAGAEKIILQDEASVIVNYHKD